MNQFIVMLVRKNLPRRHEKDTNPLIEECTLNYYNVQFYTQEIPI